MWPQLYLPLFVTSILVEHPVDGFATLPSFSAIKAPGGKNEICHAHRSKQCRSPLFEPRPTGSRNDRSKPLLAFPSSSDMVRQVSLSPGAVDVVAILGGCALLAAYHVQLYRKEIRGTSRTWRSTQADNRERWSVFVRESEGWLYAIQTLRNAITCQTFLSTTVLTLLTVITGRLWEIIRKMDAGCGQRKYLVAQLTMVASCMLTSAYHFLQSARLMTHAGFMFPVDPKTTKVDQIMRKTQTSQWLGLRWLYLSAGMISWVVGGPKVFFLSSSLLTIFFKQIDKVPEGVAEDINCGI